GSHPVMEWKSSLVRPTICVDTNAKHAFAATTCACCASVATPIVSTAALGAMVEGTSGSTAVGAPTSRWVAKGTDITVATPLVELEGLMRFKSPAVVRLGAIVRTQRCEVSS